MLETITNDMGTLNQLGDFHRKNLTTLRDALLANKLPFGMESYYYLENRIALGLIITLDMLDDLRNAQGKEDCGTAACAVGWAPVFIEPDEEFLADYSNKDRFSYNHYSAKYLLPVENYWWDWCFSGEWANVDNSRLGAAYRISMLLDADNGDLEDGPLLGEGRIDDEEADEISYFENRAKWLAERGIKE
ncbi:MAG: hypothetical protein ACK4ML_00895 [Alishewanella aestuarii]